MIELRDIRKTYRTRHETLEILKGISLSVADGTFVMLLGESGRDIRMPNRFLARSLKWRS